MVTRRRRWLPALFALFVTLLPPVASHAQQDLNTTAAQSLYDEALKQFDAKQYADACRTLEAVIKLAPEALGAKLTLGKCYEALGKLASAWSQYVLVAEMAPRMGQPERTEKATQKLRELQPRLAMLTVDVPKEAASISGLSITCDGVALDRAQWGKPLPMDTGSHELTAAAPGRNAWKTQVQVNADGEKLSVAIGPLEPPLQAPATAPIPRKPAPQAPAAPERPWQQPAGLAALVVGGVGVGVGALLGAMTISKNNQSNDGHCNSRDQCDQTGYDLRKEALALGNGSTGAMVAGGVLLAGGIVLLATAPKTRSPKPQSGRATVLDARLLVLPGGLQVKGVW